MKKLKEILLLLLLMTPNLIFSQWTVDSSSFFREVEGLKDIEMFRDHIWIRGRQDLLLHSDDLGETWTKLQKDSVYAIQSFQVLREDMAFGQVFNKLDSSSHFATIHLDSFKVETKTPFAHSNLQLLFNNERQGLLYGGDKIYETLDGGTTFDTTTIVNEVHTSIQKVLYINDSTLMALVFYKDSLTIEKNRIFENKIYLKKGKENFKEIYRNYNLVWKPIRAHWVEDSLLFLSDAGGYMMSRDTGKTFSYTVFPYGTEDVLKGWYNNVSIYNLRFLSKDTAYAHLYISEHVIPEYKNNQISMIFQTTNGGEDWLLNYIDTNMVAIGPNKIKYDDEFQYKASHNFLCLLRPLGSVFKTNNLGGGVDIPFPLTPNSIKNFSKSVNQIEVFPNPSREKIYFKSVDLEDNNLKQLIIFDNKGTLVKSVEIRAKSYDISTLGVGVYYFFIANQKQQFFKGSFVKM